MHIPIPYLSWRIEIHYIQLGKIKSLEDSKDVCGLLYSHILLIIQVYWEENGDGCNDSFGTEHSKWGADNLWFLLTVTISLAL